MECKKCGKMYMVIGTKIYCTECFAIQPTLQTYLLVVVEEDYMWSNFFFNKNKWRNSLEYDFLLSCYWYSISLVLFIYKNFEDAQETRQ